MIKSYYKLILFSVVLPLIFLATIGVKYAEHLEDNDIWFHILYGNYFLEHQTLTLDHTIFSWTPSSSDSIYCAWLSEIIFSVLYKAGGINILFVLRYVLVAALLLMGLSLLKRISMTTVPLVLLIFLCGILMSSHAIAHSKPEIFSFLLMAAMVLVWLQAKTQIKKYWPLLYLFPFLILIWVNSHGVFIFGIALLFVLILGEIVNWITTSSEELDYRCIKHLLIATVLSLLMVLINPYGWNYPLQIVNELLLNSTGFHEHTKTVGEYQSILNPKNLSVNLVGYLLISLAIYLSLLYLYAKKNKIDWAAVMMNAFFILLYLRIARTTYFWGISFVFSSLYLLRGEANSSLLKDNKFHNIIQFAIVLLFLFISFRTHYESFSSPRFGYKMNFFSPVDEANYIRDRYQGLRIGNDYNCGSYLLWALWPRNKVFIDSRYFPYKEWYSEYTYFTYAEDNTFRTSFLNKYTCDLWCIPYDYPPLKYFLNSPDWDLIYYGPSACIFISKRLNTEKSHSFSEAVYHIDNVDQGAKIIHFALSVGDTGVAAQMVKKMKPMLASREQNDLMISMFIVVGEALFRDGEYSEAFDVYSDAFKIYPHSPELYYNLGNALIKCNRINAAILNYQKALNEKPDFQNAMRNLRCASSARKQLNENITEIRDLIKSDPKNASLYSKLGNLYKNLGEYHMATHQYQKALSIKNNSMQAMNGLLFVYSEQENYRKALEVLHSMQRLQPGNPEIDYNIACIYAKQGMIDESISFLKQSIGKGFSNLKQIKQDHDLKKIRKTEYYTELIKNL